jgi:hypothetical protein
MSNHDIEKLAKIDSREAYHDDPTDYAGLLVVIRGEVRRVFPYLMDVPSALPSEDTFCDSDEWAEYRNREWLNWVAENETPNRRKEK